MSLEVFGGEGNTAEFDNIVSCCPRCEAEVDDLPNDMAKCPECCWVGRRENVVTKLPADEEPSREEFGNPVG